MGGCSRRQFISKAGGLALASAGLGAACRTLAPGASAQAVASPDGERLNVLLLLTDDQGAHLGCLGTRGIATPAADALAERGVLFRRAYATCASCSPARSSILTGMHPHSNGHWRNTHAPVLSAPDEDFGPDSRYGDIEKVGVHEDIPTLVEILNGQGYVTGITQKFHLSPPWKYPFMHRFGASSAPRSHRAAAEVFFNECSDRPFFLMANIGNTHRPFANHLVDIEAPRVDPQEIDVPGNLPDTPLLREDLARYLDTVQCADACAGAVLEALRESGRYERTLIIFTSDQGYCYHRAKATAYDMGIHVPLIVSGPGVRQDVTTGKLASHVDLVPTILDYLNLPIPATVQGRTLRPLLEGGDVSSWRRYVFAEHNAHGPNPLEYYPVRSVFDGRLHYLRNLMPERRWDGDPVSLLDAAQMPPEVGFAGPADAFPGGPWDNHSYEATVLARDEFPAQYELLAGIFKRPAEELYDLHDDPYETDDVVAEARYAAHLERLRAALDDWMEQTSDPGLALRTIPRRTGNEGPRRRRG